MRALATMPACLLALAGVGCEISDEAALLDVSTVEPMQWSPGQRIRVRGAGFPPGRAARIRLDGVMRRPGAHALEVSVELSGRATAADEVEARFTAEALRALGGRGTLHGEVVVVFDAANRGRVVGRSSPVEIDVTTGSIEQLRSETSRRRVGAALTSRLGLALAEETRAAPGLPIREVRQGSVAERAGVLTGDRLIGVGGVHAHDLSDVLPEPGADALTLRLTRRGEAAPFEVRLPVQGAGAREVRPETLRATAVALGWVLLLLVLFAPTAGIADWFARAPRDGERLALPLEPNHIRRESTHSPRQEEAAPKTPVARPERSSVPASTGHAGHVAGRDDPSRGAPPDAAVLKYRFDASAGAPQRTVDRPARSRHLSFWLRQRREIAIIATALTTLTAIPALDRAVRLHAKLEVIVLFALALRVAATWTATSSRSLRERVAAMIAAAAAVSATAIGLGSVALLGGTTDLVGLSAQPLEPWSWTLATSPIAAPALGLITLAASWRRHDRAAAALSRAVDDVVLLALAATTTAVLMGGWGTGTPQGPLRLVRATGFVLLSFGHWMWMRRAARRPSNGRMVAWSAVTLSALVVAGTIALIMLEPSTVLVVTVGRISGMAVALLVLNALARLAARRVARGPTPLHRFA